MFTLSTAVILIDLVFLAIIMLHLHSFLESLTGIMSRANDEVVNFGMISLILVAYKHSCTADHGNRNYHFDQAVDFGSS